MDKIINENLYCNSNYYNECDTNKYNHPNKKNECITSEGIHYDSCELCKDVRTKPIDLNNCTDRILKLKITINNVCFNKKVSIGVILCDSCGKIVAFKTINTILRKDGCSCYDKSCGTLRRKVSFILPKSHVCRPLDLKAHVVANYISPCEHDKDKCD